MVEFSDIFRLNRKPKSISSILNIVLYRMVKFGGEIGAFSWVGKPISGLTSGPEVENMTLQMLRVNC